jgi:hypothetical protein
MAFCRTLQAVCSTMSMGAHYLSNMISSVWLSATSPGYYRLLPPQAPRHAALCVLSATVRSFSQRVVTTFECFLASLAVILLVCLGQFREILGLEPCRCRSSHLFFPIDKVGKLFDGVDDKARSSSRFPCFSLRLLVRQRLGCPTI